MESEAQSNVIYGREYEVQISAANNESYALKVQVKVTSSTQERGRVFSPNGGDTFDVHAVTIVYTV